MTSSPLFQGTTLALNSPGLASAISRISLCIGKSQRGNAISPGDSMSDGQKSLAPSPTYRTFWYGFPPLSRMRWAKYCLTTTALHMFAGHRRQPWEWKGRSCSCPLSSKWAGLEKMRIKSGRNPRCCSHVSMKTVLASDKQTTSKSRDGWERRKRIKAGMPGQGGSFSTLLLIAAGVTPCSAR